MILVLMKEAKMMQMNPLIVVVHHQKMIAVVVTAETLMMKMTATNAKYTSRCTI